MRRTPMVEPCTFVLKGGFINMRTYANRGKGGSYQCERSHTIFLLSTLSKNYLTIITIWSSTKAGCLTFSRTLLNCDLGGWVWSNFWSFCDKVTIQCPQWSIEVIFLGGDTNSGKLKINNYWVDMVKYGCGVFDHETQEWINELIWFFRADSDAKIFG